MIKNDNKKFNSFNFSADTCDKSVNDITQHILKKLKYQSKVIYDPIFPGNEKKSIKLSNKKAKEILNWKPIYDFEKILDNTTKWYQDFFEQNDALKVSNNLLKKYLDDLEVMTNENIDDKKLFKKGFLNA